MEKKKEFNEPETTQWLEYSFTCPDCHSNETAPCPDASLHMIDFNTLSQSYVCLKCVTRWESLFTYQGYKRKERNE